MHPELDDAAVPSLAEPSFASLVGIDLVLNPPALIPHPRGQQQTGAATGAKSSRAKSKSTAKEKASFKRTRSKIGSRIWSAKPVMKALKMTYKCVYSRAFHSAVKQMVASGRTKEEANTVASGLATAAAVEWQNSTSAA